MVTEPYLLGDAVTDVARATDRDAPRLQSGQLRIREVESRRVVVDVVGAERIEPFPLDGQDERAEVARVVVEESGDRMSLHVSSGVGDHEGGAFEDVDGIGSDVDL